MRCGVEAGGGSPLGRKNMDDFQTQFAELAPWVQTAVWLLLLGAAALVVNYILKSVILKTLAPYLDQRTQTDDQAAGWAATIIPLLIVARGIELVPDLTEEIRILVSHAAEAMIVVSITMAIVRALAYANERYERLPTSKNRPIDRDTFLEAEEAKKFGLVDKVFETRPETGEETSEDGSGGAPE